MADTEDGPPVLRIIDASSEAEPADEVGWVIDLEDDDEDPHPQITSEVARLLARASTGVMRGYVIAWIEDDGAAHQSVVAGDADPLMLLGALEMLRARVIDACMEWTYDEGGGDAP